MFFVDIPLGSNLKRDEFETGRLTFLVATDSEVEASSFAGEADITRATCLGFLYSLYRTLAPAVLLRPSSGGPHKRLD